LPAGGAREQAVHGEQAGSYFELLNFGNCCCSRNILRQRTAIRDVRALSFFVHLLLTHLTQSVKVLSRQSVFVLLFAQNYRR